VINVRPSMSILFEALNKAAQAYRAQQAPVAIPLVQVPARNDLSVTCLLKWFIVLLLIGSSAFFLMRPSFFFPVSTSPLLHQSPSVSPQKADAGALKTTDSSGIAIEARSLDPSLEQDEQIKSLETSLHTAPALFEPADSQSGEKDEKVVSRFKIIDVDEEDEPLVYAQGDPAKEALQSGKWGKAIGLYTQQLKRSPHEEAVMEGLALALEHRGSEKDGDYLAALCDRYPDHAVFFAARGRLQAAKMDTKEAIYSLRRAVELDQDNADAKLSLAILYDKAGREAEALHVYQSLPQPVDPTVKARIEYLAERVLLRQAAHTPLTDETEEEE